MARGASCRRAFFSVSDKLIGDRVVATSMSNLGLERVLGREKSRWPRRCRRSICSGRNARSGNVLGGEQSGQSFFSRTARAGDGLLTAAKIARWSPCTQNRIGLIEGFKDYPQLIVNVMVRSKPPLETLPEVARALAEAQSALATMAASSFATPAPRSSPRHGRSRTRSRCPALHPVARQRPPLLHPALDRFFQRSSRLGFYGGGINDLWRQVPFKDFESRDRLAAN